MSDCTLVGVHQIWLSPTALEKWISTAWASNILAYELLLCRGGYFLIILESKEEPDAIFQEGPWFMGLYVLFLNLWTTHFDPQVDVPEEVPVWVRMPFSLFLFGIIPL